MAMGTTIHHCGAGGAGMRMKLVNNYLAIVLCQLNAEALALSQRFGLDITRTLEVLYGTTATNGQLRLNWPNKVLANDTSPGFTVDLAHKDLSLIVQAANAARVPVPVAAAAREAFSMARARIRPDRFLRHGRCALRHGPDRTRPRAGGLEAARLSALQAGVPRRRRCRREPSMRQS